MTLAFRRAVTRDNQILLHAYFRFARRVVDPTNGRVHVMLSNADHYHAWKIQRVARQLGFTSDGKVGLFDNDVPGYNPVHVDGTYSGDYMVSPIVCIFKLHG